VEINFETMIRKKPKENNQEQEEEKINKKPKITKARGMKDVLTEEYVLRDNFIKKAKAIAEFYGFKPIQTPHIEKVELFTSALGEATDIVEKQMYGLKIRGKNKLVLRPEGTAPVVRAYVENGMHTKPQPVMLFYTGSFFRHEKPQKGRSREFQQLGFEILGTDDTINDALIIKTLSAILEEAAGLKISLYLNSMGCQECRPKYKKELKSYYSKKTRNLCKNCIRRLKVNPLRLLDCKEEKCEKIKEDAPQIINFLCSDCTKHLKELLEILDASDISYYLDHHLVRGLDYYSQTVFEFFVEEKNKENEAPKKTLALGGGGRYNSLAEMITGRDIPAIGAALGVDRIVKLITKKKKTKKIPKVFFIQLGSEAKRKSLKILEALRKSKILTKHSLTKNSLKSQLKIASKLEAPYALIFGQKEALEDNIIVRNMETASQEIIPTEKLIDYLKKKL